MKKWRHVRYEDDGVDCFQCLACKKMWSLRGTPGPFCMFCGIRFEGQHECEDQGERLRAPHTRPDSVFAIQKMSKVKPCSSEWFTNGWEEVAVYDARLVNAVRAHEIARQREARDLGMGVDVRKRWFPENERPVVYRAVLRRATERDVSWLYPELASGDVVHRFFSAE